MNGTLPALLIAAAFGIAIASAHAQVRWNSLVVFVVTGASDAFATIPLAWSERVHLEAWIAIVSCSVSVHLAKALEIRVAIVLATMAGATGGAVVSVVHERASIVLLAFVALTTCLAARAAVRRVPLAPKVVSSWLIAVAMLAATLQMLPITPGYMPDHLE